MENSFPPHLNKKTKDTFLGDCAKLICLGVYLPDDVGEKQAGEGEPKPSSSQERLKQQAITTPCFSKSVTGTFQK